MSRIIYLHKIREGRGMGEINIFDMANYFLLLEPMPHKKLQKLCYYAQAWYIALNKTSLVSEDFEAWTHGPVCYRLYNKYRYCGGMKITSDSSPALGQNVANHLYNVYKIYGHFTGDQLEQITHEELPWAQTRGDLSQYSSSRKIIPKKLMQEYYSNLIS